jgi:hypothetical protein
MSVPLVIREVSVRKFGLDEQAYQAKVVIFSQGVNKHIFANGPTPQKALDAAYAKAEAIESASRLFS